VAHLSAATRRAASTLEAQVARIVHTVSTIAIAMGLLAFGLSLLLVGMDPLESLVFAIGIIVANVPEGLLPTVTLALALGVQRMARRRALVRRLSAVETLGSVSVICSDKTGTLTGNRMAVERLWLAGSEAAQTSDPGVPDPIARLLLKAASLCSNARLQPQQALGDPTEIALLQAARAVGLEPESLRRQHRRRRELPFDSHRRRMTVVVDWSGTAMLISKGAPADVLERCQRWRTPHGDQALEPQDRQRVEAANAALADAGYRVLAVALRPLATSAAAQSDAAAQPEGVEQRQAELPGERPEPWSAKAQRQGVTQGKAVVPGTEVAPRRPAAQSEAAAQRAGMEQRQPGEPQEPWPQAGQLPEAMALPEAVMQRQAVMQREAVALGDEEAMRTMEELQNTEDLQDNEELEAGLILLGLIGLYDPPRPEVPEAIRCCHQAGIKVTMVTGDHGLTAQAIARQIGLLDPVTPQPQRRGQADPVRVIEGSTLARISDLQLRQLLKYRQRLVFARMAPEQKLRLVQAYQALGEVVAVTGDGVNDAPALRAADVGVAMGRSGTDVAREAADMVLLDDNFATIVEAVRQGRAVVANIAKFITYILASNVPEIAPFLAMVMLRIPAALTVLQILAVDLGTDLLPALGLGAEPPEPGLMRRPPRPRELPLLNRTLLLRAYLVLGMVEGLVAMAGYLLVWQAHGVGLAELRSLAPVLLHHSASAALEAIQRRASTVAFGLIVACQMGNLLACRSESLPFWHRLGAASPLLWSGWLSQPLVAAMLLLPPPLAAVFSLTPLPAALLLPMALGPVALLLVDSIHKRLRQGASPAATTAPG